MLRDLGFTSCAIEADALKDSNMEEVKELLKKYQIEVASIGVNELCKVGMSRLEKPMLQIPSFADGLIHTQDELEQTTKCLCSISKKAEVHLRGV